MGPQFFVSGHLTLRVSGGGGVVEGVESERGAFLLKYYNRVVGEVTFL